MAMHRSLATLITLLALMTAPLPGSPTSDSPAASPEWKRLASLPDPVGYGGMFAGVLDGRLITGGGSQFREKPIWLKGEKTFSDRILVLDHPAGTWRESGARLPEKNGHAAFACDGHEIYIVGGIAPDGFRATGYSFRLQGEQAVTRTLPNLPKPLGYACAAIVAGRLYVAGGQHAITDKSASTEVWSLDLADRSAGWRREADLPGPGVFVPGVASDANAFYVIGGMSFTPEGKVSPSLRTHRLLARTGLWERLADLPSPRVGAAGPSAVLPDGRIHVIGGYAEVFPGAPREHPGFAAQTLYYAPETNRWSNGPVLPRTPPVDRDQPSDAGPSPMIAAPSVVWNGLAVVISGEVRAATRTPTVIAWPLAASR